MNKIQRQDKEVYIGLIFYGGEYFLEVNGDLQTLFERLDSELNDVLGFNLTDDDMINLEKTWESKRDGMLMRLEKRTIYI
jgi:hypothetical protein